MIQYFLIINLLFTEAQNINSNKDIQGAWQSQDGVMILAGKYFAYSVFDSDEFKYTKGGTWQQGESSIIFTYEFHSKDSMLVGVNDMYDLEIKGNILLLNNLEFTKIDDGKREVLFGPWIFSNRKRNGELGEPRSPDNPRKTMKLLSGTRFQWIAYNVDTKEYMSTGGGAYTAEEGKYTENIDFFSRDQSRVGASLNFDYELIDDQWHHSGFTSKGDPLYEIWSFRE